MSKKNHRRVITNVDEITMSLLPCLQVVSSNLNLDSPAIDKAMTGIEVFCAIALRVMSKCDPELIKNECNIVEIAALM